jgi:hypothetical protein
MKDNGKAKASRRKKIKHLIIYLLYFVAVLAIGARFGAFRGRSLPSANVGLTTQPASALTSSDAPENHVPFGGKFLLRQIKLITPLLDFLANDVGDFSFFSHARKYELDSKRMMGFICYVIIAK